jgi:hypothetical protein
MISSYAQKGEQYPKVSFFWTDLKSWTTWYRLVVLPSEKMIVAKSLRISEILETLFQPLFHTLLLNAQPQTTDVDLRQVHYLALRSPTLDLLPEITKSRKVGIQEIS